jgi:hypothetical protein
MVLLCELQSVIVFARFELHEQLFLRRQLTFRWQSGSGGGSGRELQCLERCLVMLACSVALVRFSLRIVTVSAGRGETEQTAGLEQQRGLVRQALQQRGATSTATNGALLPLLARCLEEFAGRRVYLLCSIGVCCFR